MTEEKDGLTLEKLTGEHVLTGVDYGTMDAPCWYDKDQTENVQYGRFVLDGVTYEIREDPSDGYRSYARDIAVVSAPVGNTFPPVRVLARMLKSEYTDDALEIIDVANGKTILIAGTRNSDDYYPWYVFEWTPEDMACNANNVHPKCNAPE